MSQEFRKINNDTPEQNVLVKLGEEIGRGRRLSVQDRLRSVPRMAYIAFLHGLAQGLKNGKGGQR
jgi:hypothetical protein